MFLHKKKTDVRLTSASQFLTQAAQGLHGAFRYTSDTEIYVTLYGKVLEQMGLHGAFKCTCKLRSLFKQSRRMSEQERFSCLYYFI